MHIAVAGNIGSGKTTLVKLLCEHYGWEPQFEENSNNPYLNDFYQDMNRWSFNLQIYFLNARLKKIYEIQKSGKNIVQDRTIYEDAYIFAANLKDMNLMTERDFKSYSELFELTTSLLNPPDLLIYLQAGVPTLLNQIKKRGISYEQGISPDYLTKLNLRYDKWIKDYKNENLLSVDVDNLNFPEKKEDFKVLTDKIDDFLKNKQQ